jgi:phage protein D
MAIDPEDGLVFLSVTVQDVELAAQVAYAEVEDNDRLIDRATVVVDDPNGALGDIPREGQTMAIDLGWMTEHAVLFEGQIVRVVTEAANGGPRRVTLVAFDPSCRLMQGLPKTRDHVGTLSDILKTIVGEYALAVGQIVLDPDPEFTEELPLRQTNRKDWAFVQEVAARYRARAFVEYNDGASQFYAIAESQLLQGEAVGALSYADGPGQLVEFRYQRIAASAAPQSTAITLDPFTGEMVTAPAPVAPPPEPPPAPDPTRADALDALGGSFGSDYTAALDQAAKAGAKPEQQRPMAIVAGLPSDPTMPERLARLDPTRALGLHGEGVAVGSVNLRAKGKVGIAGIANWAEGDWYLRQVTHIAADRQYWSRFVVTR